MELEIKETPEVAWDYATNPDSWANIENFGPPDKERLTRCDGNTYDYTNWAPALQRAIDSGAENIYFPTGKGTYSMHGDVYLRGNVKRIYGGLKEVKGNGCNQGEFYVTMHIQGGTAPVVVLEDIDNPYGEWRIVHESSSALIVRHTLPHSISSAPGAGEVFLEDISAAHVNVAPGTKVWARQLNLEAYKQPRMALNDGGDLWILGLKTENDAVLIETVNGAKTEVLGGLIYANKDFDPSKIMFKTIDASISASVGEFVTRKQAFHPVYEERNGEARLIRRADTSNYPPPAEPDYQIPPPYGRANGALIPLYVGYGGDVSSVSAAPSNLVADTLEKSNDIKMVWLDNSSNEYYFEAHRATDSDFTQDVDTIKFIPNSTNGTWAGLAYETTYYLRIRAYNPAGASAWSNVVTVTTGLSQRGDGDGLFGEYFNNRNLASPVSIYTPRLCGEFQLGRRLSGPIPRF